MPSEEFFGLRRELAPGVLDILSNAVDIAEFGINYGPAIASAIGWATLGKRVRDQYDSGSTKVWPLNTAIASTKRRRYTPLNIEMAPRNVARVEDGGADPVVHSSKMSSRSYVVGKKFGRGKKRPRPKSGIEIKSEFSSGAAGLSGNVVQAVQCAYVGHTTHPFALVLKNIGLGVVHWYMKSAGLQYTLITDRIGNVSDSVVAALDFSISYQSTDNTRGDIVSETLLGADDDTWEEFALKISNFLIRKLRWQASPGTPVSHIYRVFEVYKLMINPRHIDGHLILPARVCNASDLMITIYGESNAQIQNQTVSNSSEVSADAVDANPVRGKLYDINGSTFVMRNSGRISNKDDTAIIPSVKNGLITAWDKLAGVASPFGENRQYLKKPPAGDFWKARCRTRYVVMRPGEVRKSCINSSVTKSFAQWCNFITDHIAHLSDFGGSTPTTDWTVGSVFATNKNIPFAKTRMIALEDMCDVRQLVDANHLKIAIEVTVFSRVTAYCKKSHNTIAVTEPKWDE